MSYSCVVGRLFITACFAASPVLIAQTPGSSGPTVIRVMTRNLDAGTDLNLVLGASDQASFVQAIDATLTEISDANIPARAALVADEIGAQKPDLVGLQEVTLYRTGPLSLQPTGVQTVLYDQLDLLMSELAKRNLKYSVALVQNLLDVEVPVPTRNMNLRMTDRDAVLIRSDLLQADLDYYNLQTRRFQALLPLPVLGGITVPRSWESMQVTLHGKTFQFVSTHLETTIPGVPETVQIQLGQVQELLKSLPSDMPVVLLGDFNANAEAGLDHTGAVELVVGAGFKDAWSTLYPGDPGYTWPLFGEDQFRFQVQGPYERIDLIFSRGLTPVSARRLSYGAFWGQCASDHVGVVATLQFDN